ncbi:serine protease [Stenotrophomonas sp. SORGH_AS_0321]|uniref:trypsin-like serine peptidase n=1 Tax=Stenotrophomonas sp. SORGH_AS_0321 TaxID=3041787 RepID=UPI002858D634|nr:serine protease [Stenotrophomonas sp. SORGH_AS_0321]MDR6093966.1 lysyl endopeptidase [Stenotrophomonas sp. SORGH_AS_0321]
MKHAATYVRRLSCVLAMSSTLSLAANAAEPPVAGVTRATDVRLVSPASRGAGDTKPIVVTAKHATYIKVHLSQFDLPRGVTLEISNPDGTEVHRYSSQVRDAHTVDAALDEDGRTRFGAMSIHGDTAILRLTGTAEEPWEGHHGVHVAHYDEGLPLDQVARLAAASPLEGAVAGPRAICGANDLQPVACLAGHDNQAYNAARPVARLLIGGRFLCTAWRVGSDNRLFTNNHCFNSAAGVASTEVWFNHEAAQCGSGASAAVTKVSGATLLKTDAALDYSLFTVNQFANITRFGYLGLDVGTPRPGQEIFIPQHPQGRLKELAVTSDAQGGQRCTLISTAANGGRDASYSCDTQGGSSGSPVIGRASNRVVALHHLGWSNCTNSGARIDLIWPQVKQYFNNIVP